MDRWMDLWGGRVGRLTDGRMDNQVGDGQMEGWREDGWVAHGWWVDGCRGRVDKWVGGVDV